MTDPVWARSLADGQPDEAAAVYQQIDKLESVFGVEAGDDLRAEFKKIVGRALLRKVERESPGWDGKSRVIG